MTEDEDSDKNVEFFLTVKKWLIAFPAAFFCKCQKLNTEESEQWVVTDLLSSSFTDWLWNLILYNPMLLFCLVMLRLCENVLAQKIWMLSL